MGQDMDPATKNFLQTMAKEEFSLRRSSFFLQTSGENHTDGLLTPKHSPEKSPYSSSSVQSLKQNAVGATTEAVGGPHTPNTAHAAIASTSPAMPDVPDTPAPGLRRSKRNASTRANSAMQAITAATLHPAEWAEEEQGGEQEPPSKKAKVTLHVQSCASETSPHIDNNIDSHDASLESGSSSDTADFQQTLGIMPNNGSAGSQVGSSQLDPHVPSTGSPRKHAAPSKSKVQTDVEDQPLVDVHPLPYGQPLVWAEQRQALCETLPYYRAFQSGAYTVDGLGYGFLLDKDCGERAYMDEEVVITRAGGGCKANVSGIMEQADDQCSTSPKITSFLKNKEQFVPVALIVGSKNTTCPSVAPHRYCVMDYFQVTDIWAEKSNRKTCFKFRFEKIDLDAKSWWAPAGSPLPVRSDAKAARQACKHCNKSTPQVFENGWICLNDACNQFWKLNGHEAPANLTYNPVFLKERTSWPSHIKPPFPLRPDLLVADNKSDVNLAVSLASWKGMACPKCGRCNSRTLWDAWKCQTIGCGFTHGIKHTIIDPHAVLPDHGVEFTGHALPQDKFLDPITLREPECVGDWRIHIYDLLPGNHVTHFMANAAINNKPGGAHDMFRALQGADIGLQRFPLAMSAVEGETLTKHFAVNYGMQYKYIVSVSSKGFSEAPQVVMDALNRLTWAGQYCVSDGSFKDFNEELVLGYFEKQAIGYHDDGEKDLGPTIATLSLGGDAIMMIRLKKRYFQFPREFTFETYNPLAPVFLGSHLSKERTAVNQYYLAGNMKDYGITKAEMFRKLKKSHVKNAPPILTMKLKMGDMCVMHGAEMQKYFEHTVIPEGKLRFALTCRYVDPAGFPEEERWKGNFNIDPANLYTGDVDITADDANFSFAADGAVQPKNTAVDDALDRDHIMINSSPAAASSAEHSAIGMTDA